MLINWLMLDCSSNEFLMLILLDYSIRNFCEGSDDSFWRFFLDMKIGHFLSLKNIKWVIGEI